MSNPDTINRQLEDLNISAEHYEGVATINKYLEAHRVNQLFNVSTANLHLLTNLTNNHVL